MTDNELAAIREIMGDAMIRAFRGEIDLASALAEIRDLSSIDFEEFDLGNDEDNFDEEPEYLPGDLDDDEDLEAWSEEPEIEPLADKILQEVALDLDLALQAALGR
ncbi:hypothetical protein UFOVP1519_58 [uncultured Caudovirales phage]|uniref:Uncharacterized protein n=1 Tax=uncultured Caudovirales phage TaxID=2100421 RepID=A0A6J7X9U4_9CAUD|nr:hypothetical protein UFOVP1306_6 [uncultured Caudovirales phage]CAB4210234.1 hypothetical protein UFOVP1422_8 [uncultured Caudovirales phage]CAB5227554.1 hypothetical protein UFOVP1519_58 [uncultured Caudovirales phage]